MSFYNSYKKMQEKGRVDVFKISDVSKIILNVNTTCITCLKSGMKLEKASQETKTAYMKLLPVSESVNEDKLSFCTYCTYLLKRTAKFLQQCSKANELLYTHHLARNTNLNLCYDLQIRKLESVNVYPAEGNFQDEPKFKDEDDWCGGDELAHSDGDDDKPLIELKNSQLDGSKDEKPENVVLNENQIKIESLDECMNQKTEESHLVSQEHFKRKHKRKRKLRDGNNVIQYLNQKSQNPNQKESVRKKGLRNGFTSRMVQETEEYLVIKLTKEQVLEEMTRRKSDSKYQRAPYKCENCVKGFNFEDVLQNHLKKHSMENGSIKCDICYQYCPSAVSMRGHIKSHTTRYKCKICGEIRLSRQHLLEHHALSHTGRVLQYDCGKCTFTTNKRTVIQRHLQRHAADGARSCTRCGRVCTSVQSLRAHLLRHERDKRHTCQKCGKSFIYASLLESHEKSHSTPATEWYCVECDIRFKTQDNLRTHFRKSAAHRDPSVLKYPCKWCEKKCISESALAAHHAAAHGTAKTHICYVCDKAYSSADGLRAHGRRAHRPALPPKSYTCDLCNKTFSSGSSLSRHRRVHTGERPYACAACGARFAQPSTLRTHARLRHHPRPDGNTAQPPPSREKTTEM